MIARILVALDNSVRAAGVLRLATEIAGSFDAALYVFRAVPMVQDFPAAASNAAYRDPLPEFLRLEALGELEVLARGNARALAHPPLVRVGPPTRTIIDAADEVNADLIVIGAHTLHGLEHVLGTTTSALAVHATRNVLVVHAA